MKGTPRKGPFVVLPLGGLRLIRSRPRKRGTPNLIGIGARLGLGGEKPFELAPGEGDFCEIAVECIAGGDGEGISFAPGFYGEAD